MPFGSVVVTKLIGDKQVKLECLAADFGVRDGLMQTRSFIVDTDAALINVDGTIDLKQEQMDFTVRPKSKGLRVFSNAAAAEIAGNTVRHPPAEMKSLVWPTISCHESPSPEPGGEALRGRTDPSQTVDRGAGPPVVDVTVVTVTVPYRTLMLPSFPPALLNAPPDMEPLLVTGA